MGRHREHANDAARVKAWRDRRRDAALQAPCVRIGGLITLYQGDARVIAPTLRGIAAVITDPPYGTAFDFTKPRRSRQPLQPCSLPAARWTTNILGDDAPFDPRPWLHYPQVILWGANFCHHLLPAGGHTLIWDKRRDATPDDHPDGEEAWCNWPGVLRIHRQKWRGLVREGEENVANGPKLHPAQKPVQLMAWCVAMTTGTVLDPYMGSGTTGWPVCAWDAGSWASKSTRPTLRPPARDCRLQSITASPRSPPPPRSATALAAGHRCGAVPPAGEGRQRARGRP
jgi:site-specific DNA-methyltransferase (adenine-specific)